MGVVLPEGKTSAYNKVLYEELREHLVEQKAQIASVIKNISSEILISSHAQKNQECSTAL